MQNKRTAVLHTHITQSATFRTGNLLLDTTQLLRIKTFCGGGKFDQQARGKSL